MTAEHRAYELLNARIRVRTAGIRIVLKSLQHDPRVVGSAERLAHMLADLDAIDKLVSGDPTPILPNPVIPKDASCQPR